MQVLESNSEYLRTTCNFPVSSRPTTDFMVGPIANFAPTTKSIGGCAGAIKTSIAGHTCSGSVYWHIGSHPHIDYSGSYTCDCQPWAPFYSSSEDAFGSYNSEVGKYSTDFSCTASPSSTTNFWFGSCIDGGACTSYELLPTAFPRSCVDVANLQENPADGPYYLDLNADGVPETTAYCDFDGDYAWTMVESFSFTNGAGAFKTVPLSEHFEVSAGAASESVFFRTWGCLLQVTY